MQPVYRTFLAAALIVLLPAAVSPAAAQDDEQARWFGGGYDDVTTLAYGIPDSDYVALHFSCATGKPMVSFAYDDEAYQLERGGFYDLDLVFPGPICRTFDQLQDALDGIFDRRVDESYEFRRRLFFDHVDPHSAARVVERVRDLTEAHGVGKPLGERIA